MANHELCYRESLPLAGGIYLSSGEHKLQPVNKASGLNFAKLFETLNATAPTGLVAGASSRGELLSNKAAAESPSHGDTCAVTCPVAAGIEPHAVRLEILTDPSLPKQGPGRRADGGFYVSEITIAAARGNESATAIEVLDVQSDIRQPPISALVDVRPETVWGVPGDMKNHEAVLRIGLPSRTGVDGVRCRYPIASSKPLTSLVVTIAHPNAPNYGAATLEKFGCSFSMKIPPPRRML
jgi:hypothetical protein